MNDPVCQPESVLLHPGFFSAARFRMPGKGVILSEAKDPGRQPESVLLTYGILRHFVPQNDSYSVILSEAKDPVRRAVSFANLRRCM